MKTVIITGGSRGIGAAAVRAFCARGDRVAFLYEKEDEKAQAVAAETGAQAVRCDVADEAAIRAAFSQLPGADGCCRAGCGPRDWKPPRGRGLCSLVGAGSVRLMERLIFPFSSPITMTLTVCPSVR